jgi:hypothetical protein
LEKWRIPRWNGKVWYFGIKARIYFEDGALWFVGEVKEGNMCGKCNVRYWRNGKMFFRGSYSRPSYFKPSENPRILFCIEFHPNGNISNIGTMAGFMDPINSIEINETGTQRRLNQSNIS